MRQTKLLLTILFGMALVLFLALVPGASARSGGISGYSGNPATNGGQICNACHSGGITPVVTLSGPTMVAVSATNVYTLTISGGQQSYGGFDVSANGGVLAINEIGTQLLDGEVTHLNRRPVNASNEVVFTFQWQAPATPGPYTLYGAGNSVNNGNGTNGDQAAADTLMVNVGAPTAVSHIRARVAAVGIGALWPLAGWLVLATAVATVEHRRERGDRPLPP